MKVAKPGTIDEPRVQVSVDVAIQAVKDKLFWSILSMMLTNLFFMLKRLNGDRMY